MDPAKRRKLTRAINLVILRSETVLAGPGAPKITKVVGDGWQAYVYVPAGPGSETLHVEIKLAA